MEKEDLVGEHPVSAAIAVFTLAAVAWVFVTGLLRGPAGLDPLSTVLFAGTFTVVYVGFARYS